MRKKVVGFGDLLISFAPVGYQRFIQAETMDVCYTGAEANVLVSLANFGVPTELVTRVPDNEIAKCALACMRKYAVGTEHVCVGGDRLGVIYTEKGASQRPSMVVYDRKGTSMCQAMPGDFAWDAIFQDADWFHFTGITAALSDGTEALCMEAVQAAKAMGLRISCDLNYRKKLWTEEKAGAVMKKLVPYADVLIANEEDADKVLGIRSGGSDVNAGQLNYDGYEEVARRIHDVYGCATVGITLRRSISASDNEWSAMLYSGGKAYFSRKYPIHIVNRVGGGDAFTAGLIYAIRAGEAPRAAIEFAAAASCLKHTIEKDFNLITLDEARSLANGNVSGRVVR